MNLLFHHLGNNGASEILVRSLMALFNEKRGCVNGASGYGEIFDIFSVTNEGGVESPFFKFLVRLLHI